MLDFGGGRQTKSVKSMNSMKSVDRILVQNSRQRVRGFNGKLKKKKTQQQHPLLLLPYFIWTNSNLQVLNSNLFKSKKLFKITWNCFIVLGFRSARHRKSRPGEGTVRGDWKNAFITWEPAQKWNEKGDRASSVGQWSYFDWTLSCFGKLKWYALGWICWGWQWILLIAETGLLVWCNGDPC